MLNGNEAPENAIPEQWRCETYSIQALAIKWGVQPSTPYNLHHEGKLTIVSCGASSIRIESATATDHKEKRRPAWQTGAARERLGDVPNDTRC